ncbi:hypothetical protein EV360DRAFT_76428, partial [Lentinula raphanica]
SHRTPHEARKNNHDPLSLTHIFTANNFFTFTDRDLEGENVVGRYLRPHAAVMVTLKPRPDWSLMSNDNPPYLLAGSYGISTTLRLVQYAHIGLAGPLTVQFDPTTLAEFNRYSAFDARESGFEFTLESFIDRKNYEGSVGPCDADCKDPFGVVSMTYDGITHGPSVVFWGRVLQSEKPEQKDVLRQCKDYLVTAFNDPDTYFVPPPGPKAQDDQEGKKRKSTSDDPQAAKRVKGG